nr:hypothetical protein [Tanacetum cinerariifolium]
MIQICHQSNLGQIKFITVRVIGIQDHRPFGKLAQRAQYQVKRTHIVDKQLEYIPHKEDDIMLHIEKTGMLMLVVEVDVGGMTADGIDNLTCLSNDVQPKQVDLRSAQTLTELHWHDTHVDPDRHEVDQRDENLIRTLGDYSKPSHEGYRNTIKLPAGSNVEDKNVRTPQRTYNQQGPRKSADQGRGQISRHQKRKFHLSRQERRRRKQKHNVVIDNTDKETNGTNIEVPVKEVEIKNKAKNDVKNKPTKKTKNDEVVEASSSRPTYNVSPKGPVYDAILKKKITKKEDIGGNFEIPCSTGGLKNINALVDQGFDVNIMPYSTYMKLTDERPTETDIRLSLASHSCIYPLGIAEDVLVDIFEHVYPVDFVILDIKEDKKRLFILGLPFLRTAKAVIKFDKGTVTLRSGKSKISFHTIPEPFCKIERGVKNDIESIAPTMTMNRLVL